VIFGRPMSRPPYLRDGFQTLFISAPRVALGADASSRLCRQAVGHLSARGGPSHHVFSALLRATARGIGSLTRIQLRPRTGIDRRFLITWLARRGKRFARGGAAGGAAHTCPPHPPDHRGPCWGILS